MKHRRRKSIVKTSRFRDFSMAFKLGIPPKSPKRSKRTEYTYTGTPMRRHRKKIQITLVRDLNHLLLFSSSLLNFCRVVPFEKFEVLIKAFCSIKYIEIVFSNYKIMEFMVSEFGEGTQLFVECL